MVLKGQIQKTLFIGWLISALFYGYDFLVRASTNAVASHLIKSIHLNAIDISVIGSVFYWFYVAGQIPAGISVDRFGVKRVLVCATLFVALGNLLFAIGHSFMFLCVARALMGFGAGFAFVSALKLASDYFAPRYFPLFAGFTQLFGYMGAALSGTPLACLMHHQNWRLIFLLMAFIGLALFFLTLFFVKSMKWNKESLYITQVHHTNAISRLLKQIIRLCFNPQMFINGMYCSFMMGATSVFSALWGINYLMIVKGQTEVVAATTSSLVFLGVALTSPLWGAVASALNSNKAPLMIAAFLATINTYCLLYASIPVWLLYLTGFLFGAFQSAHVLNFTIVSRLVSKNYLGSSLAFMNIFTAGGGALLQPLTGTLIDYSHRASQHSVYYNTHDYKFGLAIIPIVQFLSFVLSILLIEKKSSGSSGTQPIMASAI